MVQGKGGSKRKTNKARRKLRGGAAWEVGVVSPNVDGGGGGVDPQTGDYTADPNLLMGWAAEQLDRPTDNEWTAEIRSDMPHAVWGFSTEVRRPLSPPRWVYKGKDNILNEFKKEHGDYEGPILGDGGDALDWKKTEWFWEGWGAWKWTIIPVFLLLLGGCLFFLFMFRSNVREPKDEDEEHDEPRHPAQRTGSSQTHRRSASSHQHSRVRR